MSDVPYAVLLSGGLDSSLVSAIAQYVAKRVEDEDKTDAWWPRLHSFSVGFKGARTASGTRGCRPWRHYYQNVFTIKRV